ncbi:MAG: trypsin-like peptidase domain-containing protein [Spirochaetota bacterium]
MRLYSRSQVTIIALASVLVGILLAIGTGVLPLHGANVEQGKQTAQTDPASTGAAETWTSPVQASDLNRDANLYLIDSLAGFTQDERENIDVYERFNNGVVNITTETVAINWFLEPVPQAGGSGSGSIIDTRGYILTNHHVIKDAFKVFINLADGSRFEGKVIGSDPENDLAVLKFDPPRGVALTIIPFGDSSNLRVGQKVLAIGNPFGLERTLTRGIVSGLGRPVQQDARTIIRDMIQTDASINPGNSGGPLLNSRGELIGINTMIYSPSGGSVGVGFAVPIATAKRVVPDLITHGMVMRGWVDAEYVQLFPALVEYMKESGNPTPVEKGLLVSVVRKGTNTDRAGIRGGTKPVRYYRSVFNVGGDILVSVDGMEVSSIADMYSALEDNKPGDTVAIEFFRGSRRIKGEILLSDRTEYMDGR